MRSREPFKRVVCPIHEGVTVGRIEVAPDGTKDVVVWTRTLLGPNRIEGGRRPEEGDEVRLSLTDPRIGRGKIPFLVTWCRKCRGELVLKMDWVLEAALHPGVVQAPDRVLDSSRQVKSPGPEVR